jgi:putative DNA primase/helicase
MAVLGDYAATADFSAFLKKDRISSGPSDDIANLAGARLVSSIEVDDGKHLAQGLLKQLAGGDTVRARHLYKASFEFRPQFSLWLVCNHAPQVAHDDDALWRRLLRLPFENVIPKAKRDKALRATLTDPELAGPAILNWLVQGSAEWYLAGLQIPSSVQRATEVYKKTSNPLAEFVKECCVLSVAVYCSVADMRHAYDDWRSEYGETSNLNRNQFAAAMRELGCSAAVKMGQRCWSGIALRDDSEQLYSAGRTGCSPRSSNRDATKV